MHKPSRLPRTDNSIFDLCRLICQDPLGRLKLSMSSDGLFFECLELGIGCSLRAPSVPLATVLTSSALKGHQQRKLLLSYFLVKAVWQFYDSDWMTEEWTKHTVQFMKQHGKNSQNDVLLNHRPYILTNFQASPRRIDPAFDQINSSDSNQTTTETQTPKKSSHIFPKVLALGIMLLEIQIGEGIEHHHHEDFFDSSGRLRENATHITAGGILNSEEWKYRPHGLKTVREVIELCVKPDTSKLGTDPTRVRESLNAYVVEPLRKLFDKMHPCPEGPDCFDPGPMKLEPFGGSVSMQDSADMRRVIKTGDTVVASKQSHLAETLPAHFADRDGLHHTQSSDSDSETIASDVEDCELFGDDREVPDDDPAAKDVDGWMTQFKLHRKRCGIGRDKGNPIRVAILDTGIDASHPDVEKHSSRIRAYKSFVDSNATVDTSGHGTHIAGILLDLTNNVDLYIVKFTESRVSAVEEYDRVRERIVQALKHARASNVQMISLSFGFNKANTPDQVQQEIEKCLNEGIVVFASASNDGGNRPRTYPGNYDRVLCIHSTTAKGKVSSFSPSPEGPDTKKDNFSVVGECIKSWWPLKSSQGIADSERTKRKSGTSFATPVAVSIAAFMIGYIRKNMPDHSWSVKPLSPEGVRKIFLLMSRENKIDGYDYVSPEWFFTRYKDNKIKQDLLDILRGGKM